jgi:hypothetical protein
MRRERSLEEPLRRFSRGAARFGGINVAIAEMVRMNVGEWGVGRANQGAFLRMG